VDADVDVATPSEGSETEPNLVGAVGRVLADCPGMLMWTELRQLLPVETAASVYEAAATAVRAARN
jgi:hypothetical protein